MERDARAGGGRSRSEVISRSRPKELRPFRGRSIVRTTGTTCGNESGSREHLLAIALGIVTTAAIAVWMKSVVGKTTLAIHATTGASAILIVAPIGTYAWRLERFLGGRNHARLMHGTLMAIFFLTLNAAIGFAFKMRYDSRGVHLYSLHSWVGLASLVLAKMSFADAFASHLTSACNIRSLYGFKIPTFQHSRHIAAAGASCAAATSAIVLGAAQMQGRINLKSKGRQLLRPQSLAANVIAIAAVATAVLTVSAVLKRRNSVVREKDSTAPKLPVLEVETPSV